MAFRWKLVLSYLLVVLLCLVTFYGWTEGWLEVWTAGLFLIGGAGAVFVISRRYTRAIERLSEAAGKVASGDFVDTIPVRSRDELGHLARNMEQMSSRLQIHVERLDSERNYLTTVLNSMAEAVLVTDFRGRITEINPAFHRIFGLETDPIGKMPLEVIRNPEVQTGIQNVLRKNIFQREEIRAGEKVLVAQFAPIHTYDALLGVVTVFHDVTQLRRLENLRKEFVSNVSHELRTPLTSIQGYAETLLSEEELGEIHHQFVAKILRHAQHLSELIEELLKLARLESGEEQLVIQPVSFVSLMEEIKKEFAQRLAEKEIDFMSKNFVPRDEFLAGRVYIKRILHNLMDNALKYTSRGFVEITLRENDSELVFAVRDTGVGIPKEHLERVFERFYRLQQDRSRDSGGSGIGLAIVKHLVQLHGGRVWAESEVGRGTTMYFTLPA